MTTQRTVILVFSLVVILGAVYFVTKRAAPLAESGSIVWTDFETGRTRATAEHKKMLVDVYTDWCVWCKRMNTDTYANAVVSAYVNDHFVPVRLNAESQAARHFDQTTMTDQELATAFKVSGYPTTIFVSSDGQPITSMDGYIAADEFKSVLRYIAEDGYRTMPYEQFKQGGR